MTFYFLLSIHNCLTVYSNGVLFYSRAASLEAIKSIVLHPYTYLLSITITQVGSLQYSNSINNIFYNTFYIQNTCSILSCSVLSV